MFFLVPEFKKLLKTTVSFIVTTQGRNFQKHPETLVILGGLVGFSSQLNSSQVLLVLTQDLTQDDECREADAADEADCALSALQVTCWER